MKASFQPLSSENASVHRFADRCAVAVLVAGVVLSLAQFLFNRSLWLDEASLALNVIHRSSAELLQPLDYGQVAPILFLQIEKLFSTILPNSEYGLRLFPLLCFWASLYFFRQITRKLLHPYAMLIALSLFVFSYLFLYYSSEVKQYMSDVLTALCMFYLVQKDYRNRQYKYGVLALAGVVAVFLSNVAPVILFACGMYWAYDRFFVARRGNIFPMLGVFAVWLGVFALYYVFFIHNHPSKDFMVEYWAQQNAFLPPNPFKADFYLFFVKYLSMLLMISYNFETYAMRLIWKIFFGLFVMTGIIALLKDRKINILIFVFTPLLLHLLLSAFHLYPFYRRLVLYAMPGVIIAFSYGLDSVIRLAASRAKTGKIRQFATMTVCLSFLGFLFLIQGFPFKHTEMRNCLQYVQEHVKSADEKIYISISQFPATQYYTDVGMITFDVCLLGDSQCKPTNDISNHLDDYSQRLMSHMLNAGKTHGERMILDNMKTLRGKNWIFLGNEAHEDLFHHIGGKKLKEYKSVNASVYLYDFGE
jgi:hypothetical protein